MSGHEMLKFPALSFRYFAAFAVMTVLAWSIPGCATQQQVRDIVAESNAALVTATILGVGGGGAALPPYPGIGTDPATSGEEPWLAPCEKINAFIETHPDQKVAASTLRIRQGVLLLGYKQYNLARAAFDLVEPQYLITARDKTLYRVHPHLVWWFRMSEATSMSLEEYQEADRILEALQTEIDTLKESPGIRDYLAEMRVWIALFAAEKITNTARAKAYFEDGINHYAEIFTEEDLEALKQGSNPSEWDVSMDGARRRVRSRAVIKYAKAVVKKQGIVPNFESPVFSELVGGAI
jgi:hypothetical protein